MDTTKVTWTQNIASRILKSGVIPKHVAFIMDGNRRYANKANIERSDGHKHGFDTLAKVLNWCRELGIHQVTLYAFSIENFKRTRDEIDSIMNLAREKCDSLLDELDRVNEAGIRVRVAGNLKLLPEDVRFKIERIQNMTKNNDRAFLNICLAYTSRFEITDAVQTLAREVEDNVDSNIDECSLERHLHLGRPFPELIIRTSGEIRLSDFMLWQCQESMLMFVDALWPEITFWDLMKAIFLFQCYKKIGTN